MTETKLNSNDKLRLRSDIKISMILGVLLSFASIILVGVMLGLLLVFGKRPVDGFLTRSLFIIGLLLMPVIAISWTSLLKYIDLKKGKKLIYKTSDYKVVNKRNSACIVTSSDDKQKIKIDKALVPVIKPSQPLTVEISGLTKSLLFISHDNENLLEKLYNNGNKQANA